MDTNMPNVRWPLLRSPMVISTEGVPHFQVGGELQALQGQSAQRVHNHIIPQIDGFKTGEEIVCSCSQAEDVTPEWVAFALETLIDMGVCAVDREAPGDQELRRHYFPQIAYFGQHISHPTLYQKRLQASKVAIIGLGYLGSSLAQHLALSGVGHVRAIGKPMLLPEEGALINSDQTVSHKTRRHRLAADRLQALGCAVQYEGVEAPSDAPLDWNMSLTDCDLAVLVLPRPKSSWLRAFNQACFARAAPYLPVWLEATGAQVGPLVVPHETACLLCLELRRRHHLARDDFFDMQVQDDLVMTGGEEDAFLIPWLSTVASIAACEAVTALTHYRQPTSYGRELFLSRQDWRLQVTPVLKVPRCPVCGPRGRQPSPQPFALSPQKDEPHA